MEHVQTTYPPLQRGALRLNGIFGVTWQLYKRSFRGVFPLTLLCVTLPMLLISLINLLFGANWIFRSFSFEGFSFGLQNPSDLLQASSAILGASALITLVSLAYSFLLAPAYNGALYLEMDQCMEGRRGTFGQLLRYAMPVGFKHLYTTFLSSLLISIGIGFVIGILFVIFIAILMIGSLPSLMFSVEIASYDFLIVPTVVITVLTILLAAVGSVFTVFIYPVAVHEHKVAFRAVSRSFKLAASRFWRILGVFLLYVLIVIIIEGILLVLPAFLLQQNPMLILIVVYILAAVLVSFITPYTAALANALYVDAAAREAQKMAPPLPQQTPPTHPGPASAQEEVPPSQLPYFSARARGQDDRDTQE